MHGRVWSVFQASRSVGSALKFRIQDLADHQINDAIELFVKYYLNEETLLKAAGVARNPKAVSEYRLLLSESMKDPAFHNMICCVAGGEGKGEIIGASSMVLVTVGSNVSPFNKTKPETKEMQIYTRLDVASSNLQALMKGNNIAQYYEDMGVIVHPQFRELGIGRQFARARRLACIARNVAATGGMTTSIGSELAAKKDNWDAAAEIDLKQLGQKHGVTFDEGAVSKLVVWKNPEFKQDNCQL